MIQEGLLWYDDTEHESAQKIDQAIARYQHKYSRLPDVCYVGKSFPLGENDHVVRGIKVIPNKNILPHHFWLGMDEPKPRRADSPADQFRRPGREGMTSPAHGPDPERRRD